MGGLHVGCLVLRCACWDVPSPCLCAHAHTRSEVEEQQAAVGSGAELVSPRLATLDHEGPWRGSLEMQPGYQPIEQQQQQQQRQAAGGRNGDRAALMAGLPNSTAYDPGED